MRDRYRQNRHIDMLRYIIVNGVYGVNEAFCGFLRLVGEQII